MALVAHADIGALVVLTDADGHAPVVHGDKAVAHGVFHNGLERQRRQAQPVKIVRQLALVQSGEALDTAAYRMTAEIAVTDAVLQPLPGQLDALRAGMKRRF